MSELENLWRGDFGDDYTERNLQPERGSIRSNVALFGRILAATDGVQSILEVGAGAGLNLRAIRELEPLARLGAVEINRKAAEALVDIDHCTIYNTSALEFRSPYTWDLVFSKGLLIHIPPQDLDAVYRKLVEASRRYVLVCEYYCPKPRMIPYRGKDNALWARDFAGEMMAQHPLRLVDYGFVYHKDPNPQDDVTWFLMEKR